MCGSLRIISFHSLRAHTSHTISSLFSIKHYFQKDLIEEIVCEDASLNSSLMDVSKSKDERLRVKWCLGSGVAWGEFNLNNL